MRYEQILFVGPGGIQVGIYVDTPDPAHQEPRDESGDEREESDAVVLRFPERECA